jgi:hypothetical protein
MGWWNDLKPIGKIGVCVLIVAVLFIGDKVYNYLNKPTPGSPVITEQDCELTAAALGLIATGLRNHDTAEAILGTLGAAGFECGSIVKFWVSDSGQATTASINGENQQLSGTQVAQVPAQANSNNIDHFMYCIEKYAIGTDQEQECLAQ